MSAAANASPAPSERERVAAWPRYVVLAAVSILMLYPLLWLVGACVIWMVTASLLLCTLGHRMDAFVWPYDQWLDAAPHWRANWLMTLGIVL